MIRPLRDDDLQNGRVRPPDGVLRGPLVPLAASLHHDASLVNPQRGGLSPAEDQRAEDADLCPKRSGPRGDLGLRMDPPVLREHRARCRPEVEGGLNGDGRRVPG